MQLIGFVRNSSTIGFGIPIYLYEDHYYVHEVSHSYKIYYFSKIELEHEDIELSPTFIDSTFKVGELCGIAFYYGKIVVIDRVDNFLKKVNTLKDNLGWNNIYLNREIKYIRKCTRFRFNREKLDVASEMMRAVAHPLRLRILSFIDQHERVNVNQIYNMLKIEQSITSQHLKILRLANILEVDRYKSGVYYSVNYQILLKIQKAVQTFLNSYLNQKNDINFDLLNKEISDRIRKDNLT